MARRVIIQPVSARESYSYASGVDSLNFHLPSEGSISGLRLCSKLNFSANNGAGEVVLDPIIGAQGFIDQITINAMGSGETLEQQRHYARVVKTRFACANAVEDLAGTSKGARELIGGSVDAAGKIVMDIGAKLPEFALDLHMGMFESGPIPLSRYGGLDVQIQLASDQRALQRNGGSLSTYSLSEVFLTGYIIDEEPGEAKSPVEFISYFTVPRPVNTGRQMFTMTVPYPVVSAFQSYISSADDADSGSLSYSLSVPPDLELVHFLRGGRSFPYDLPLYAGDGSIGAIISKRFVDAVGGAQRIADGFSPQTDFRALAAFDSVEGSGVRYATPMDFSSVPWSMEIQSGATSGAPYTAYLTFKVIRSA